MNAREFEARQFYRFRLRRQRQLVAALTLVVLLATLGLLAWFGKLPSLGLSPLPPKDIPSDGLFVNSGLTRAMLTRVKTFNYEFQPPEASDHTSLGGTNVVTALLEGDLRDSKTGNQFPASLVQLNASPISPGRIQLSTVINPGQVHSAAGGVYQGTVQVFAGKNVLRIPLVLYLAPRDGVRAFAAFLLLVIGATIGLAVKWITESLTRLATARWRLEDLRRSVGGDRNSLPHMAAAQLEEIDDRIRRQDSDEHIDEAFAPLLSNLHHLHTFATAIRSSQEESDRQRDLGYNLLGWDESNWNKPIDQEFIESIARAESTRIERLRTRDWPWSDPAATINEAQALADQCSTATLALSDVLGDRIKLNTVEVLDLFRKGDFANAVALYSQPQSPIAPSQPPPETKEPKFATRFRQPSYYQYRPTLFGLFNLGEGGLVPWMAQRPRWFAGAASVFVVSLVGLQLQYLNSDNFGGELGDWLGLLLWAAVIELSGVSVLDVLSRLGSGTGNVPRGGAVPPVAPAGARDGQR